MTKICSLLELTCGGLLDGAGGFYCKSVSTTIQVAAQVVYKSPSRVFVRLRGYRKSGLPSLRNDDGFARLVLNWENTVLWHGWLCTLGFGYMEILEAL